MIKKTIKLTPSKSNTNRPTITLTPKKNNKNIKTTPSMKKGYA